MSGSDGRDPVVVTGMGVVTALGRGAPSLWDAVLTGRSGVRPVRSFATSDYATCLGAEVPAALLPSSYRDGAGRPLLGRAAALSRLAACDALSGAGVHGEDLDVVVGTTMGEPTWIETWPEQDARAWPPLPHRAAELLAGTPDVLAADTARHVGAGGRVLALGGACAAGNGALAWGLDALRDGRHTRVLAGGVDAFSRTAFTGFAKLGALARDGCRPFGRDRQGLVLGEGAAFLVLERRSTAAGRGAAELAVLAGAGLACDAHHPTAPLPSGAGAAVALRSALDDARVDRCDVDWVCAHGTGTPANDAAEVAALHRVFGDGPRPPATSLKSLTGHGLGAASAVEAVLSVLALQQQVIPPTWHAGEQDPALDWDIVPDEPREAPLRIIANQAYAFGGIDVVTVLAAPGWMPCS